MSMIFEIVELLQHEVRRVVEDVAALVAADRLEEALEGRAVEQILAGMNFVGDVAAGLVEGVEDRPPAARQFLERRLDQPRRALRPGIDVRPGERAGEGRVRLEAETLRRLGGVQHLFDRPLLPRSGLAVHFRRGETVEGVVESRVHRDELTLQMRREFGDREPVACGDAFELVAIGLRSGCLGEIDQASVPGGNLHALVAERSRPFADRSE